MFEKTNPVVVFVLLTVAVLVVVGLAFYSYARNKSIEKIRGDVYDLFLKAEHLYAESGSGEERMTWVVDKAYILLPKVVQLFVSKEMIRTIFKKWFTEIKDLLDDGKRNQSAKLISQTLATKDDDSEEDIE